MLKKLAVLLAAVAVSAPAFADRGNHYGHRVAPVQHYYVQHRPVVVHRPAVVHHYYRPAPRPVVVVQQRPAYPGVALLAGAIIGAAIVHHATTTSYGY
ncbi:MAG TPA: hypothetical protein VNC62_09925 [Burkholderiales bacterium]|jgi:hypothetical protein|nr:hypothetical protein [Burkholderiales bacterium]HVJ23302.1 hypothetical protein [Burkholderiales bacterium]